MLLAWGDYGYPVPVFYWGHLPIPLEGFFSSHVCDYDATNGTISGGNIYRFPSSLPAVRVFLGGGGADDDP